MFLPPRSCTSCMMFVSQIACHRAWIPLPNLLPSLLPKLPNLVLNPERSAQPDLLPRWQPGLQPGLQPSLRLESLFQLPLFLLSMCSSSK